MDKYENEIEILKEYNNNLENEVSKLRLKLCIQYMLGIMNNKLDSNTAVRMLTPLAMYLVPTGKLPIIPNITVRFIYEEFVSWIIGNHPQAKDKFDLCEDENIRYYKDRPDHYEYILKVINNLKGDTDICEY